MTCHLCLIRHGETDWNLARRMQGHIDIALNARGQAQARALAKSLTGQSFSAIYASDLARARETASVSAQELGLAVTTEPLLRERHYGDFQGRTYEESRQAFPEAYERFIARDVDADFPGGGESLTIFFARVRAALEAIAARHSGSHVLVVTHGGVLDMAHRLASHLPLEQRRNFAIGNATVNWMRREQGSWRIETWDGRAHLDNSQDELPG
ncbi:histidine phosphatase family protein [Niveibacterium terrae]|uniref:histidine phosphatase family protein n=1 Tax=Niveibacterium terrae TaxID=3373598 RepID=UPI003A954601